MYMYLISQPCASVHKTFAVYYPSPISSKIFLFDLIFNMAEDVTGIFYIRLDGSLTGVTALKSQPIDRYSPLSSQLDF